ncbi:MAG: anaerobic carbon-monoxide dehydrogenase catalytic subunit [Oligoflexia bacterium]|nr:anaerobic carbon-monoxide dehydrogenase catalytic subunit [Oligoflexia bacterium]
MEDKKIKRAEERVCDEASIQLLNKAEKESIDTCFNRMDTQQLQCKFATSGICCKICHMGPCRITPKAPKGVCGADADTIVARNFLREVAGGVAAHSDHGRHLVLRLKKVAEGNGGGYEIKDEDALRRAAQDYGIDIFNEQGDGKNGEKKSKSKEEIALALSKIFIEEFSSQEDDVKTISLAPLKRQNIWKNLNVIPKGIDRMVVESMHRTTMGVDHDYNNILFHAVRTSLADGWAGSRIASITSDILFGTPKPVVSNANLGVLSHDTVNIIVHGHEPELSEMLAQVVLLPEIKKYASEKGAKGITLAGICCTANEILLRHGIPVAGNFLQQELAIVTGAVEMLVIDVQCCMPSLPDIAKNYHTEIVSTTEMAKTIGAKEMHLNEDDLLSSVKDLVKRAIDNFTKRDKKKVCIPSNKKPLVAGFSVAAIKQMLGGNYRASFRPLNDAIIQGRIRGLVGIVGCNNPKSKMDDYMNTLARELIKNDVLILETGCAAIAAAKEGMLTPETALSLAGPGLREVCETVGMPPILHMGSCVDNSRILEAATEVLAEGGLGDDFCDLPAVGVAPEWMSEKAVAIGTYFVASGVDVILGHPFYISGSDNVSKFLNERTKEIFGGSFHVILDPLKACDEILSIIDRKREKLGINKKAERKLFDMKDRRGANV